MDDDGELVERVAKEFGIQPGDRVTWRRISKRRTKDYAGVLREIKQRGDYIYAIVAVEPHGRWVYPSVNRLTRVEDTAVTGHYVQSEGFGSGEHRLKFLTPANGTKRDSDSPSLKQAAQEPGSNEGAGAFSLWMPPLKPKKVTTPDAQFLLETLTDREVEILRLVAVGLSNQEIADHVTISERTVRTHVSNLLSKLNLTNRTEATLLALGEGVANANIIQSLYRERNNDSEPPNSGGAFWMETTNPPARDLILLAQAPWGEWRMRRSNGKWEPYAPHRLRAMKARFWGPIGLPVEWK